MVKRIALGLTLLLALSGPVAAGQLEDQAAEIEDVLQLVAQGVSDEIIIKHIEARGFVYDLTADEILQLRDRGISETVIAAMLDTAIDNQPSQREREPVNDQAEQNDVDVYLGAGYFSPWYYYPYAWSYYYDPFPVYYSAYYYPFAFSIGWGWYGSSNYWYPNYWGGYGWCDPYYWDYAYCRPGCWVPAPDYYADRWESGRGLPSDRSAPPRTRTGEAVNRVHQASTSAPRTSQPATSVRQGTSVAGTRQGQPATSVRQGTSTASPRQGQPSTQVREGQPASRVRSGQSATRVRTPSTTRGSQPAVKGETTSTPRTQNRSSRVSNRVNRQRVHTRATTPSAATSSFRRPSSFAPSRSSQSSVAPRTSATPRSEVRAPSSSRSSMRAPSSGFRAPSSSFSRPSAPSGRAGGHVSSPRGPSGGGRR